MYHHPNYMYQSPLVVILFILTLFPIKRAEILLIFWHNYFKHLI